MEERKRFLMECHVAGRQYYDANEAWNKLSIGTPLRLERDKENRFDGNAVMVVFHDKIEECDYKLGYIPRYGNTELASLLDMGWQDMFECRISHLFPEAYYEQQIRITISIRKRNG